jgi:hypothetical protein
MLLVVDVLKIVGTLMREHNFYHICVFTKSNGGNVHKLSTYHNENRPFNPQVLAATSGAAMIQRYMVFAEWISHLA